MSDRDLELSNWQAEWSKLGDSPELANELATRVKADQRALYLASAKQIGGGIFALGMMIMLVIRNNGEPVIAIVAIAVTAFTAIALTRFFSEREGLFSPSQESTEAFIEMTRRRLAANESWLAFSQRSMFVFLPCFAVFRVWLFMQHRALYAAEPWRVLVGDGVGLACLALCIAWLRVRARRATEARERFERAVADVVLE